MQNPTTFCPLYPPVCHQVGPWPGRLWHWLPGRSDLWALFRRFRSRKRPATSSPTRLIVGLGNPGPEYAAHRHNIGFQVVDALAEKWGLRFDKFEHKARVAIGEIEDQTVLLAKPLTFMNRSGEAVRALAHAYNIPPSAILVVYDDLDIPLGTIRLRPKGSSGGHRGMRSIIERLGTEDFPRLRIGIGRPPAGWDAADYVLTPFTEDELPLVVDAKERAVAAIECWLKEGLDAAMNRFNR